MTELEIARQSWRVGYERAWIEAHRVPPVPLSPILLVRDERNGLGVYNAMTYGT